MNIMNYREDATAHCYAHLGLREESCLMTKTNLYACAKCQRNHKKTHKKLNKGILNNYCCYGNQIRGKQKHLYVSKTTHLVCYWLTEGKSTVCYQRRWSNTNLVALLRPCCVKAAIKNTSLYQSYIRSRFWII